LLEDDLPSRIKNASQVFFYFSGHGHPGGVGQDSYLVPYDGNVHSLVRSGISIRKLYQELSKLDAQNKMVFLDACFSGNTARGGHVDPLIAGSKPAYIEITLPVEPSLVSLTAAAANQESNAYPAKFHSLFTYFVLRDLQNRPANISELSSRVIRDVENQIGEMFGNAQTQTPVLVTATDVDKTAPLVKR
jgi:uncharacterized caspase-like protein